MGLFDKLKKKTTENEDNSAAPIINTPAAAVEVPKSMPVEADRVSGETPTMPTSKIEKEDFSSLSNLQVLEKIDQYVNEFKRTPNKMVFGKLSAAVDEFDERFSSIPLSKRGSISQDWSFLKMQRDNMKSSINSPTNFAVILADQITSYVGKIYTELCK